MIGKIIISYFQYYNAQQSRMRFKKRPMLIIGNADIEDYVALPISKISDQTRIDGIYDIKVESASYPNVSLNEAISYIRTHKQVIINKASIQTQIANLKTLYPDLFLNVMEKVEQFQKEMIDKSLS